MFKVTLTTPNGLTTSLKSKTNKNIKFDQLGYCFILKHKNHEFLKQFYHGANGIHMGSNKYNQIIELEKKYKDVYISDVLGVKVSFERLDGRTSYAKSLRYFSADSLF